LKGLRLDLDLGDVAMTANVPLEAAIAWFNKLVRRNEASRAQDGQTVTISVRVVCPNCRAGITTLTAVVEEGVRKRACRACGHRFDVE